MVLDRESLCNKIGKYIVYKKHAVYEITDIKEEKISGVKKDYFVLKSVYDDRSAIYVPTDSESLLSRMTEPFSRAEALRIIEESKDCEAIWLENTSERFAYFDRLMEEDHLPRIIKAYFLLAFKREQAQSCKKKFFAHDERTMQSAQKLICEALAFSLGINKKEVISFISEKIS